eukprot:scaffold51558_cov29-Tisochrysis_lutea.AAC.3
MVTNRPEKRNDANQMDMKFIMPKRTLGISEKSWPIPSNAHMLHTIEMRTRPNEGQCRLPIA